MRRKVTIVVFGLLVLAVIAQSIALVERRRGDDADDFAFGGDHGIVQFRKTWPSAPVPPIPTVDLRKLKAMASTGKSVKATGSDSNVVWKFSVTSDRLPYAAAYEDAFKKARAALMHELDLTEPPTDEYIREKLVTNYNEEKGQTIEGVADTYQVRYDLSLTRETARELAQHERELRIHDRMGWLARVVAGVTVFLGCVAGYIRLDEMTKGYYTGRLRLLTVVVLLAAFGGIAATLH
jgi:hypothetical protein